MDAAQSSQSVATPATRQSLFSKLISGQPLPALLARLGAWFSSLFGRPLRLGTLVVAGRHNDVCEILARDLDFCIAPINAARIDAVNGPFVLGMDRDARLMQERRALYEALARTDLSPVREAILGQAKTRIDRSDDKIDVVAEYARPVAAVTAHTLFGIRGMDELLFMDVARAIFAHIFLNIGGDKAIEDRAVHAAR
jgi:cytochrome P450